MNEYNGVIRTRDEMLDALELFWDGPGTKEVREAFMRDIDAYITDNRERLAQAIEEHYALDRMASLPRRRREIMHKVAKYCARMVREGSEL